MVFWFFLGALLLFFAQRLLHRLIWARGLSVELSFDSATAVAGDDVAITERALNRKLLPLPVLRYRYGLCRNFEQLRGKDSRSVEISRRLAAPAMRSVRSRTVLHGLERGIYTVTGGEMRSQDLFFSQTEQRPIVSRSRLTVYPRRLEAQLLRLPCRQLLGAVLTRRSVQEDPFELRGIRPYESYDSMRMINWKATARTGELKVNQHAWTTDEALCLILDAEHGTVAQRELLIRYASSLSRVLLQRGISVSLRVNGRSCIGGREITVPAGSGSSQQTVIDENLTQLKLNAEALLPFAAYLRRLAGQPRTPALPVVLSVGGSTEICDAFDALCGSGGGYYLSLGQPAPAGSCFTVLPLAAEEAAS